MGAIDGRAGLMGAHWHSPKGANMLAEVLTPGAVFMRPMRAPTTWMPTMSG